MVRGPRTTLWLVIRLQRTVRFAAVAPSGTPRSGYGGWPSADRGEPWYEAVVTCAGAADPRAGYLIDIKVIDRAVRETLARACVGMAAGTGREPCGVLGGELAPMQGLLGGILESVRWRLTPYYSLEMSVKNTGRALLRQRFDFAASHRLFVPGLSDEENARLFGKCSRVNGHGHNYQLEPCVEVAVDGCGRTAMMPGALEEIVARVILDRFDHTHLNLDTPEFSPAGGLNPTVENIAMVFHGLLRPEIERQAGASLRSVTVWETDRTSATFGE